VSNRKWLVALTLAAVSLSLVQAEPHCPGNVTSLPLRLVQRSQLVMRVDINRQGPFDFLVDTGAQVTTVDPALAAELNLQTKGTAGVTGVGVSGRAPLTQLDLVEAGSHEVEHVLAVIQNLGQIQMEDHRVRGVLGGNFLEHFDLLIDYGRQILCLDDSIRMRSAVKGQHIALVKGASSGAGAPQKLIVAVRVSGEKRDLLLQLDSGTNAPLLYETGKDMARLQTAGTLLRGRGTDGKEHAVALLAAQDVRVGPHVLQQVSFVVPVGGVKSAKEGVDGLLPAALFERVFVDYAEHYVVLEPW
jgi:hypothetical protein